MFQKILVPLDGSATSERILPHVEMLIQGGAAGVHLLRVCGRSKTGRAAAQAYLLQVMEKYADRLGWLESSTVVGRPATAILEFAVKQGCDLIAMTTHARAGMQRAIHGSVASAVIAHSPLPVFLALPHVLPAATRSILVPMDGSHRARAILPMAAALATASHAGVHLLWVVDESEKLVRTRAASYQLEESRKQLEELDVPVTISIRRGDPAEAILRLAAVESPDLIAMTTHGRTGLDRMRFGSVTEAVLRKSLVPMLVLRTAGVGDGFVETLTPRFRARRKVAAIAE